MFPLSNLVGGDKTVARLSLPCISPVFQAYHQYFQHIISIFPYSHFPSSRPPAGFPPPLDGNRANTCVDIEFWQQ
jgi:hypothetical protein